jgi:O-antigen/teichoic acid export membrane protein
MSGILRRSRQVALVVSGGISVVGMVTVWWLSADLAPNQYHTIFLMLLLLPFISVNKNQLAALRGLDRVTAGLAIEMLLQPAVALLSVATLFLLSAQWRGPEYAMLCQASAVMVSILCVYVVLNRAQPCEMNETDPEYRTSRWLKSAVPFTLIGGAAIINSQTDILMLGWLRSAEEVGVYRVAVQGAVLVAFGLVALDAVLAPNFARLHTQKDIRRLQRLATLSSRAILLSALPFVLLFVFAGGKIAGWVFGDEFEISHFPLAVLALAQLVNASMGSVGYLLNMTGHEKDSANVLIGTAMLNVLLNAIMIPTFGFKGAAVATAISIVVWKVTLALMVKKRLGLNPTAFARLEMKSS